jgi:hypothetical protein
MDAGYVEWPDHVNYIGYADTELRRKLLSEASFGFLMSTYWEPFGGTAIEMMLSGCVPITSDVGAMTEYIVDGVNGFRCNTMGDVLRAISLVPTIDRKKMANFAEANFSLEAVKPKFERAFDDFSDVVFGAGWYEEHNRPLKTGVGLDYGPLYKDVIKGTPNDFEKSFWGDCTNTKDEEDKQFVYANFMGLFSYLIGNKFMLGGKRVVDIGGGPVSMMLKSEGLKPGSVVVDPLGYPDWVIARYNAKGISYIQARGEDECWVQDVYDEAWIYNCLQHVDDPAKIIDNAFKSAPVLRIFEWIDFPAYEGHPQALTKDLMEKWVGKVGHTVTLSESGCFGNAFYGVFTRS